MNERINEQRVEDAYVALRDTSLTFQLIHVIEKDKIIIFMNFMFMIFKSVYILSFQISVSVIKIKEKN